MSEKRKNWYDEPWSVLDPRGYIFSEQALQIALEEAFEIWNQDNTVYNSSYKLQIDGIILINDRLIEKFGPWLAAWHAFGSGEGSMGAISENWCCVDHDFPTASGPITSAPIQAAISQIKATICDVRNIFLELGKRFDLLSTATFQLSETEKLITIRKEIPELVNWCVNVTKTNDLWYAFLQYAIQWSLDVCAIPRDPILNERLDDLISACFHSWVPPSEEDQIKFSNDLIVELKKITNLQ